MKRNDWLTVALPATPDATRFAARALTVFVALVCFGIMALMYSTKWGPYLATDRGDDELPPDDNARDDDPDNDDDTPLAALGGVTVGFSMFFGVGCIAISFAALELAQRHLNFTGPRSKFFAESAYCVYLIHAYVIVVCEWAYVVAYDRRVGGLRSGDDAPRIHFAKGSVASSTRWESDGDLWLGWACTVVVSQLIVWPLAAAIRKLPGLNKIL